MGSKGAKQVLGESQAIENWSLEADRMLSQMLTHRGWGYAELAEALAPLGIKRTAEVINRRINRGGFSAAFFLTCMAAMNVEVQLRPKGARAKVLKQEK